MGTTAHELHPKHGKTVRNDGHAVGQVGRKALLALEFTDWIIFSAMGTG